VEILVAITITVVILTAIYQLLMSQNRLYMKQNELMDVRTTLRAASTLLAWELRQASASGDLYTTETYQLALRSIQGTGIVCGVHSSQPRIGVWGTAGEFGNAAEDSALLFIAGAKGIQDDEWRAVDVTNVWIPGGGVPDCVWDDGAGGTVASEAALEIAGDMDGLRVGGPVRAFRKIEYSIYLDGDRWWLGRKVGDAADYEQLTGPLRPPGDSGLAFVYYDDSGATTTDPSAVSMVDIVLKGVSLRKAPMSTEAPDFQMDTLRLRVLLRN
jgi:hypothetical protein